MPSDLPDLPIAQVRHFLLVAEHGGFHAAAEKAFRTQPAIDGRRQDMARARSSERHG